MDPRALDPEVRADLRSLSRTTADTVARHLVVAGRLLDDDPEQALAHARAAAALSGRVGVVREALGIAAYNAEQWAEALSELRTARRITGRPDHLAVMADSERALGRPERAVAYLDDPDLKRVPPTAQVELAIVVAGARRDLGQPEAAVVLLQGPVRDTRHRRPPPLRLWYAFADALLATGRPDEARTWFASVAEHDTQGETDADERLLELDGVVLDDLQSTEDDDEHAPDPIDLEALVATVSSAARTPEPQPGPEPVPPGAPQSAPDAVPGLPPAQDAAAAGGPLFSDGGAAERAVPVVRPVASVPFAPPEVASAEGAADGSPDGDEQHSGTPL